MGNFTKIREEYIKDLMGTLDYSAISQYQVLIDKEKTGTLILCWQKYKLIHINFKYVKKWVCIGKLISYVHSNSVISIPGS